MAFCLPRSFLIAYGRFRHANGLGSALHLERWLLLKQDMMDFNTLLMKGWVAWHTDDFSVLFCFYTALSAPTLRKEGGGGREGGGTIFRHHETDGVE